MSMKKVYKCDICRDAVDVDQLYGLKFCNLKAFEINGPTSTDGVHICKGCAKQLREQLNMTHIARELENVT